MKLRKNTLLFWSIIALHCVFWAFATSLFVPNYWPDTVEMLVIGQHWVVSTFRHPAFNAWVVEILSALTGHANCVPYLAAQISVFFSLLGIWKLAKRYLPERLAMVAVLAMLSYVYFNYESILYNNRTFARCFWIWGVYWLYQALETDRKRYWILTGLALTAGLYCKLHLLFLVLAMVLYLHFDRDKRGLWKTSGPYLTTVTSFILFLPLLVWIVRCDFSLLNRAGNCLLQNAYGQWGHVVCPLFFLGKQFLTLLPVVIPLLPLTGFRWRFDWGRFGASWQSRFLAFFVLAPIAFSLLIIAFKGLEMRTALGCHLWVFAPVFLLYFLKLQDTPRRWKTGFGMAAANVLIIAALTVTLVHFGPAIKRRGSRIHFDGRGFAAQVQQLWAERYDSPVPFVRGDAWPCANVAAYSAPNHPEVYCPVWSDEAEFRKRGGVLLWMENGKEGFANCFSNDDFAYSPRTRNPDAWLAQFPNAEVLPVLEVPFVTGFKVPPARIGIAIVPPGTPENCHPALRR